MMPRLYFRYEYEYGSFYLYQYDGDHRMMVSMVDSIAMAYDPETYTMFKHGNPKEIQKYVDKVRAAGLPCNMIVFTKEAPLEEINKVLSTSGYLKYVINEPANKHTVSG